MSAWTWGPKSRYRSTVLTHMCREAGGFREVCCDISRQEANLGLKQAISQHTSLGLWGIELVREPRHAPVIRGLGCLTSTVLRYLANRVPNPAENPDIAAHYF